MRSAITQSPNYKWWAFSAVAVGGFTSALDQLSVTVALPTIAEHFGSDLPTAQWMIVGYGLTVSVMLLPMGRLGDIVGRKQVYLAGFLIFVLCAALAGSSQNIAILILARVIQGCGAAMIQSTGRAMIIPIFSSEERGKVLGAQMSVTGAGAIAGPALGGLLVSTLGWQWVFFINVPAGILALVAVFLLVKQSHSPEGSPRSQFDWLGSALSIGTLVAFLLAITNGYRIGWLSPPILAGAVIFLVLLALFVWWELRTTAPMLDLRLFRLRSFSLGTTAAYLSFLGIFPIFFLMPFYFQNVRGYSPGEIGLIMVPSFLGMIVMAPVGGVLSDRYGWRPFKVGGLAFSVVGLAILSQIGEDSELGLVMTGMILQGCGMGIFGSPNTNAVLSAVDQSRYGVVSAFLGLLRNSASVISTAVATAIVTVTMVSMGYPPSLEAVSEAPDAFVLGLRRTYIVLVFLLLLAMALSLGKVKQDETEPAPSVEQMGSD